MIEREWMASKKAEVEANDTKDVKEVIIASNSEMGAI